MKKSINSYYLENKQNYINKWGDYCGSINDDAIEKKKFKKLFKWFMYNNFNIKKIDLRIPFWKSIYNKGLQIGGYSL